MTTQILCNKTTCAEVELMGMLHAMLDLVKIGGWTFDVVTHIQQWTPEVYSITESSPDLIKEGPFKGMNFYTPESRPIVRKAIRETILYGTPYELELKIITAKGNLKWVRTSGKAIKKNDRAVRIIGAIQDITAQKELELELRELGLVDALTGLNNRRHFNQQFEVEMMRCRRHVTMSLLIGDIDNFKKINDTYGHAYGDKVLIALAETIKKNIRAMDIANRYGGEEITVMLPSTDLASAYLVAEKIRKAFGCTAIKGPSGETIQTTLSIGITEISPGETAEAFFVRADTNMYKAKQSGKDRICS